MSVKSRGFARFAVVGYKDDTGIGRQCHNMRAVLEIGYHLVAPSTRLPSQALDSQHDRPLLPTASHDDISNAIRDLEGIFVIERNKWHTALFETVKALGKQLILVPNWEWFDETDRCYTLVDLFIVHSRHAFAFLNFHGFTNVIILPPPVDLTLLPERLITSRPTVFVHNAGIIDLSDRKGTFATLRAWAAKKPSSARLIVNYQKSELPLPEEADQRTVSVTAGSIAAPVELYASGQCALQPSRLEGLGYMVLEPILCGIPTITTNAPPMNELTAGTLQCEAHVSLEHSLPRRRGCGKAPLYDVSTSALATVIEHIEACDVSRLSQEALQFRRELDQDRVKSKWMAELAQL